MSVPPASEAAVTCSTEHPHEPETAPVYDAEGGCLVCGISVRDDKIAALQAAGAEIVRLREAIANHVEPTLNHGRHEHDQLRAVLANLEGLGA